MNEHDDFELKRALVALPRSIEPPADFWPEIRGRLPGGDAQTRRRAGVQWLAPRTLRIAALLTLLGISAGALVLTRRSAAIWQVADATGAARRFSVGEQLATGARAARFTVGTIGEVDADAGTSVRLLAARWSEHRLALARGTLHARITAPPRVFIVETPSGIAVDLGCAYTLEVDSAGNSALRVTAGWVEFTERGRTSLIPAGFRAEARRGLGVGTPVANDAPPSLLAAVHALDASAMANDSALAVILREARTRDAVTLWHLLNGRRGSVSARARVYERLAAMVPPPSAKARSGAGYDDAFTMRLWWQKLPGTLPIVPEWERTLWMLYLRVAG